MPHISLTLYKGKNRQEIEKIAQNLRKSLIDTIGWKASDISVSIEETDACKFVSNVNKKITTEEMVLSSDYIR